MVIKYHFFPEKNPRYLIGRATARPIIVQGFYEGKNVTFYQLIRNFLSILLVYSHGTIFNQELSTQKILEIL